MKEVLWNQTKRRQNNIRRGREQRSQNVALRRKVHDAGLYGTFSVYCTIIRDHDSESLVVCKTQNSYALLSIPSPGLSRSCPPILYK